MTAGKASANVKNVEPLVKELRRVTEKLPQPLVNQIIDQHGKDPFLILISCLISLRARDTTTIHICRELFRKAKTPEELLALNTSELEAILFKSGFYKNKAKALREVCQQLLDNFGGKVPSTEQELHSIKGIGPKTANLVLGMAFDVPAICVDTHVHRLSNLFGLVKTKTPEQTEAELKKVIPKKYWVEWNYLLVIYGQNVLGPNRKQLPQCPVIDLVKSDTWPFESGFKD